MKRMIDLFVIFALLQCAWVAGCASSSGVLSEQQEKSDVRSEMEAEFGVLEQEHLDGFERELQAQYQQLKLHYRDYDKVRKAPESAVAGDHEEHRLHRKLKRRHRTLARLHEDRMWLYDDPQQREESKDHKMARIHRSAARWHDNHFQDDGQGIEDQDTKLKTLRSEFEKLEVGSPDDKATDFGQ